MANPAPFQPTEVSPWTMQIKCPHCQSKLTLASPKPGRYKPKCKRCGEPFVLLVSDDDPPKIRVGIAKSDGKRNPQTGSSQSSSHASTSGTSKLTNPVVDPNRTRSGSEQTLDQTMEARHTTSRAESSDLSFQSDKPQTRSGKKLPAASPIDASNAADASDDDDFGSDPSDIPARLGGYRLIRMLGRGAMGAVYQAKQISLDRDVALKTIRGRFAKNPASLARFTREAYAAAQLTHHNVVQIYDFGEDAGLHYFSMEWIRGGSLADLVREKGRIAPKLAATYILQAARGLQYAHRNGMVHRDVKPANLLLADDGVVKVADLGLVKIPDQVDPEPIQDATLLSGLQSGTQVTMQGTAVGTPAYMAPEQSADSSTVDHRADIYSLGCSLFYLLAGRSPYSGEEPADVLEQHAKAALPDLAEINRHAPKELVAIVSRAMAKRPSERYASLAEMIDDLHIFLGVDFTVGFSPTQTQADRWEELAAAYAKTQRLRSWSGVLFACFALLSLVGTVAVPFASLSLLLLCPTMFVSACAAVVFFGGIAGTDPLAKSLRAWFETLSLFELIAMGVVAIAIPFVMVITGLWLGVIIGLALGIGRGAAYHFALVATSIKSGQASLDEAKRFIRDLRIAGVEENGLRDFVARFAGQHWQPTYEVLFGYEALQATRTRLKGDHSFTGPIDGGTIRDRLYRNLAERTKSKREAKDRKKLAALEQHALVSQGVSAKEAHEQAWQVASAVMESVQKVVDSSPGNERVQAEAKRQRIKAMLADARSGKYKRPRDKHASWKLALSGYTRMLTGCLLLTVFSFALQASELFDQTSGTENSAAFNPVSAFRQGKLSLHEIPADLTTNALGITTNLWSIGMAGVLLCMSAFVSGWRMSPFALVATLVILLGPTLGIPAIEIPGIVSLPAWIVAVAAALVIYLPGAIYGEEPER
ncbi:hypothetical protein C2E31_00635 [Rhodopirellula baltica]|nr:hypothetical protein C2E31_00635 [Rhodopirellula baltica]